MKTVLRISAALVAAQALTMAAPVPISGTFTYTQDFTGLPAAAAPWVDDGTLPGWYAQINNAAAGNLQVSDGTSTPVLNGLLNLGPAAGADRALGSKATGTIANIAYGVLFRNTGTTPVSLDQIIYTGELWRTNSGTGTPAVAVAEDFALFYQVSSTPVTNIISGTNSATAAAGTGFTALGAGAGWISPTITPLGAALDGNAPANKTTVTFSAPSGIVVPAGQYLLLKWTDSNEAGTDGYQAIDDVSVRFVELNGLMVPSASLFTRNQNGTLTVPTDDTFGFSASVTATGTAIGSGWTTASVTTPNATSASYGATVVWTGFPVATAKVVNFVDNLTPAITTTLTGNVPHIIGVNDLDGGTAIVHDGAPLSAWVADETLRTLTQTNSPSQADRLVQSLPIDLSTTGFALLSADMDAITGASGGFELQDGFRLDLIIDGGAPVSILGAADTNSDGRLNGAPSAGTELPDTLAVGVTKPFSFSYIIPAAANSVIVRITGNSSSPNETFVVKNLRLSTPPPTLLATPGTVTVQNNNTPSPADDTFGAPVTITPVFLTSTGWTSDSVPAGGPYSVPTVVFGNYPLSGGPKTVTLSNAVPAVSAMFTLTPPAITLAATPAMNITRLENGPGIADDTVSFETTITGANGGPGWAATGATPASGAFGTVTLTVPAGTASATVTIKDISYPAATQDLTVTLPGRYVIGQKYFLGAITDVATPLATAPAAEWINNAAARTLDMITGGATDKVVLSDEIPLSSIGTVYFQANFRARETSTTSNFETADRFKAELIIDGTSVVSLVSSQDAGDGAPAVGAGGGPNGPPNGFINGYQGIAVAPATVGDDYNLNAIRDEFNITGAPVTAELNHLFKLSATIPAAANSVQLRITGANIAASEFFTVSDVIFSTASPTTDTDGDGVPDLTEISDGTNPTNPASSFTLSDVLVTPTPGTSNAQFTTVNGRLYQGYTSTDFVTWTRDGTTPITGTGAPAIWPLVELAPPAARRYLRVINGRVPTDFPPTLP